MDPTTVLAASGLRARMQSLDLLANNLANSSTSGFKTDGEYYTLFSSDDADSPTSENASSVPWIDQHWTDYSQGTLTPTNSPYDLALSGQGFFVVSGVSSPLYTRNGSFRVSPDGQLVMEDGHTLIGTDGQPIKVDPTLPLEIASDGTVQQQGESVGQLQVVEFAPNVKMGKQGKNYFKLVSSNTKPLDTSTAEVHQGSLEASNVKAPESAVQLINIMRQFEMLQKAVLIADDMTKKSIEEVARVTS